MSIILTLLMLECHDFEAMESLIRAETKGTTQELGLKKYGHQNLPNKATLLVVYSNQEDVVNGVKYRHYYFFAKSAGKGPDFLGEIVSIGGASPFSGGPLINGYPIVYDAQVPGRGYLHYVFWENHYQSVSDLSKVAILKVLHLLTDCPTTRKYLFDGSKGSSRYEYD